MKLIATRVMILASDSLHRVVHFFAVEQGTFVVFMFDVLQSWSQFS